MFSLILILIGLVLVAVLATATIYYGGEATTEGSANSEAAALLAQSAQIASASAAYTADHNGVKPKSLDELVTGKYLTSIPPGWAGSGEGETPVTSKIIESANACELFNARQGIEGIPYCNEITTLTSPVCCQ